MEVLRSDASTLNGLEVSSSAQNGLFFWVSEFSIKRDPKWGGDKKYTDFEEVEKDFAEEVCCRSFFLIRGGVSHFPTLL